MNHVAVLVLLVSLGAAGAIFALDLQMPLGVAVSILYVPVIAFSALALRRRWVAVLGTLVTVLTIVAWALSPAGGVPWMGAVNRVATILAIWSVLLCRIVQHHGAGRRATDHERTRAQR